MAVATSSASGHGALVSVQRMALAGAGVDRDELDIATVERLYVLVLRLDPEARFCLADGEQRCAVSGDGYTQAGLLRELAHARQQAVERAGRSRTSVRWQVVSLASADTGSADADEAGVRITGAQGPIAASTVHFNRAPHASCMASSGEDGVAVCHLVDQHGDDDLHSGHDGMPVLASFPGDAGKARILLPTTLIMKAKP